ncbi:hypothetical protein Rmf_44050 [Roseomonas fluvialis]|uniref:Uncharacterized protein n=1 Tax=Roseomonas fluvialis TaxID=1750527 RepID=A0ABM7Y914_9PROT|nr:hypothetical protein Rmf_44050 [Roseomonas fluvialis]
MRVSTSRKPAPAWALAGGLARNSGFACAKGFPGITITDLPHARDPCRFRTGISGPLLSHPKARPAPAGGYGRLLWGSATVTRNSAGYPTVVQSLATAFIQAHTSDLEPNCAALGTLTAGRG